MRRRRRRWRRSRRRMRSYEEEEEEVQEVIEKEDHAAPERRLSHSGAVAPQVSTQQECDRHHLIH